MHAPLGSLDRYAWTSQYCMPYLGLSTALTPPFFTLSCFVLCMDPVTRSQQRYTFVDAYDPDLVTQAIELLVELASLQTSFMALDKAIKTTNRRVNALENVVKPKLENTIQYIKVSIVTDI